MNYQHRQTGGTGLVNEVDGTSGYWVGWLLSRTECEAIYRIVERGFMSKLTEIIPDSINRFGDVGMERYHELDGLIDHPTVWHRAARLFPHEAVPVIEDSSIMTAIREQYGEAQISNEENGGEPEIHWRIVRPYQPRDIAPLHADQWYWNTNKWKWPCGKRPIKIWTMLSLQPDVHGLRVVTGSHRKSDWQYESVALDGLHKPIFDERNLTSAAEVLHTPQGTTVIFNHDLLHGGALNRSDHCRISFEFTVLVPHR